MIFADTSAWVEFVRDTGSPACNLLDKALDGDIAICDAVRLEVLAGARSDRHFRDLHRLLARAAVVPTIPDDYDTAALIYRSCRRGGETPRSLIDCLIAAVAIRAGIALLHADRDFDVIARHCRLETVAGL
ncbi:MAG: PIN domain nuclease [bacterium]|nr:PIN domain nuclease [bacterium]MCY3889124.1 PIN domain nuclease [bacterium]MCY4133989.1 PIN domain nuclease [bacterium]